MSELQLFVFEIWVKASSGFGLGTSQALFNSYKLSTRWIPYSEFTFFLVAFKPENKKKLQLWEVLCEEKRGGHKDARNILLCCIPGQDLSFLNFSAALISAWWESCLNRFYRWGRKVMVFFSTLFLSHLFQIKSGSWKAVAFCGEKNSQQSSICHSPWQLLFFFSV